jgi:hypothetical protein
LIQGGIVHRIPGQIAILGIPLQQAPAFQKAADSVGDGVRQLGEFLAGAGLSNSGGLKISDPVSSLTF